MDVRDFKDLIRNPDSREALRCFAKLALELSCNYNQTSQDRSVLDVSWLIV